MTYNIPWAEVDDNPTKSDQASNLDVYVRKVPDAIAERLTNMFSGFAQGETAEGIKRLEFIDQASDPADNKTVYTKGGEAYLKDGVGNIVQLSIGGRTPSSFPSGTKMLFYQDTAPIGWTILTSVNDKLVFVTKGSGAGGLAGGVVHNTGSWTISGLTGPSHTHNTTIPAGGWSALATIYSGYLCVGRGTYTWGEIGHTSNRTLNSGASGTGSVSSDGTWRPAAYNVIIATKD